MYLDMNPLLPLEIHVHQCLQASAEVGDSVTLINSLIGEGVHVGDKSVISHSYLHKQLRVGRGCIISGIVPQDIPVSIHITCF